MSDLARQAYDAQRAQLAAERDGDGTTTDEPTPPDGFRWWHDDDGDFPAPSLAADARYGVVGRWLDVIEPETEASAAVVGAVTLVELGTLIGRRAVVSIGMHEHYANLFEVVVGETSIGAKGTADIAAHQLLRRIEPGFAVKHEIGGLGSGEKLVELLRDSDDNPCEKRRLIHEAEFSAVLRVGRRESSILSDIIRKGFDHQPIQHHTKGSGDIIATGHHLSIVGSITPAELLALSGDLDIENGWLNRFLLIHARMAQLLPFGGHVVPAVVELLAGEIADNLQRLDDEHHGRYWITPNTPTGDVWEPWYRQVRTGSGSTTFMRALTSRQHAQAARIALIQAVVNGADTITPEHLRSAIAWSDYSVGTARMLFGRRASGPAGKLLEAIRAAGPSGLAARDQHAVFGRNISAEALDQLRQFLVRERQIATFVVPSGGRPRDVAIAITPLTNERTN